MDDTWKCNIEDKRIKVLEWMRRGVRKLSIRIIMIIQWVGRIGSVTKFRVNKYELLRGL